MIQTAAPRHGRDGAGFPSNADRLYAPLHWRSGGAEITGLFRDHGYDGASLSLIMKATGLVKASLYHRFASGKEEMAATVMDRVAGEFASSLLAPLSESGDPEERLRETGKGWHECRHSNEVEIDNACPRGRGRGNLVRAGQIKVEVYQRRVSERGGNKQRRGQHQGR